jgi:hypothetical protein
MIDKQEVESKVMEFLREKSKVTGPYTENMSFRDDLGLDSVDLSWYFLWKIYLARRSTIQSWRI